MIQIPKLKFGDPASRAWCERWGEKLKLLKSTWTPVSKLHAPTSCLICDREITNEAMYNGRLHAHPACIDDLRDLSIRSGGGLR